ncbi:CUB domain [Cinara cedri]|uniref:CUB domain n=1 Tax=Cinara cedri TaxID=506608 RepID=A0A5E4M7T7_9HEMI|nr:CUB domain [Cinara cedri]
MRQQRPQQSPLTTPDVVPLEIRWYKPVYRYIFTDLATPVFIPIILHQYRYSTMEIGDLQSTTLPTNAGSGCDGPKRGKCINEAVCLKLNGVVNAVCQNPGINTNEVCCSFPDHLQSTITVMAGPNCKNPEGAKCIHEDMCFELNGVVNGACDIPGYDSRGICCTVKQEQDFQKVGVMDYEKKFDTFKYVNPNYPGMLNSIGNHLFTFKRVSRSIHQIRLDFITFNLALPNETTKVCTEDVMVITHGSSKEFKICGPYNDKHVYYNLEDDNEEFIYINITLFKKNFDRDWEIKVTQLMGHQKVPDMCFQFFEEITGSVQMTNITLNGGDLNSGKNNRICILHKPRM